MSRPAIALSAIAAVVAIAPSAFAVAEEKPAYTVVIQDHRFEPSELKIPAGQKVRLVVDNRGAGPEEFESYELHREKVIPGGSKATLYIGPLEPGRYPFFGEFHPDTAQGAVIAE